jgi:transposase
MAAILTIGRLCEPSSELHIAEDWYRTTALEDLLGVPAEQVNDDRLYRTLDQLLPHKTAIEQHLRDRLGELFSLDYDLLLYDVTSTYFEGLVEQNDMARRGYSRDHRSDCKQVCIALVVTRDGIPLGYEVFAGNRSDVTTVEDVVSAMEERFGVANQIWVMDRGMMSEDNISWLREGERRYIIGTSRAELRRWSKHLTDERDWKRVRDGIDVKLCEGPDGEETFILCRSVERREKEKAMHMRFVTRIADGLSRLGQRLARSRKKLDRGRIERQIGRLLQRNSRGAGRYVVRVEEDPGMKCGLRLSWQVRPEWDEWARHSEGCYVLRTNVKDWTSEALWKAYVQLTDAEAAFRIQKSDLSLRPVWHQRSDRVQAHILVCFLAYVMWKTLEQWQSRAGLGNSPRTVLQELRNIHSTDVVLPTLEQPSRDLRIRCVVHPERAQAILLSRLGVDLPQRLRIPREIAKM